MTKEKKDIIDNMSHGTLLSRGDIILEYLKQRRATLKEISQATKISIQGVRICLYVMLGRGEIKKIANRHYERV